MQPATGARAPARPIKRPWLSPARAYHAATIIISIMVSDSSPELTDALVHKMSHLSRLERLAHRGRSVCDAAE